MPTGVALMMTSKVSFFRSARLAILALAWWASFCAGAAVRFRM